MRPSITQQLKAYNLNRNLRIILVKKKQTAQVKEPLIFL